MLYKYVHPSSNPQINCWYIDWHITDWCNYSCPYCIQTIDHHYASQPYESQELVEKYAKCIREKIKGRYIHLSLHGGEISQYDLLSICRILFENNNVVGTVNLTTNLSAPIEKYISFCEQNYGDKIKFKIVSSYHWTDLQKYIDKAKILAKNYKSFMVVSVVHDKITLEQMKVVAETFKENKIPFKFTHGRIPNANGKLYKISDECLEYLEKINSEFKIDNAKLIYSDGTTKVFKSRSNLLNQVATDLNLDGANFKGMYCFSGTIIYPSGKVYCGSCPDRKKMYKGLITDPNVSLSPTKEICGGKGFCNLCDCMLIWSGKY